MLVKSYELYGKLFQFNFDIIYVLLLNNQINKEKIIIIIKKLDEKTKSNFYNNETNFI